MNTNTKTNMHVNIFGGNSTNPNLCTKCWKPFYDNGNLSIMRELCQCWKEFILPIVQPTFGWVCPKCNGGVAPGIDRCPCTPILYYTSTDTNFIFNPELPIINSENEDAKKG